MQCLYLFLDSHHRVLPPPLYIEGRGGFKVTLDDNRRAAASHHEHGSAAADGLIIDVDADYSIGAHLCGAVSHLVHRCVFCLYQNTFISAASASEEIGQTGFEIFNGIGADNGLACDDSKILLDGAAFDDGCSCE